MLKIDIPALVNAFVLLPWPSPSTLAGAVSEDGLLGAGGVLDHAPGEPGSTELAAALDTLDGLDRTARVVHLDPRALARASASRPFWADLIDRPRTSARPTTDMRGSRPMGSRRRQCDARGPAMSTRNGGLHRVALAPVEPMPGMVTSRTDVFW
jgi:hypothetical protein